MNEDCMISSSFIFFVFKPSLLSAILLLKNSTSLLFLTILRSCQLPQKVVRRNLLWRDQVGSIFLQISCTAYKINASLMPHDAGIRVYSLLVGSFILILGLVLQQVLPHQLHLEVSLHFAWWVLGLVSGHFTWNRATSFIATPAKAKGIPKVRADRQMCVTINFIEYSFDVKWGD